MIEIRVFMQILGLRFLEFISRILTQISTIIMNIHFYTKPFAIHVEESKM